MKMKLGTLAKKRERRVLEYLKENGPATRDTIQTDLIKKISIDVTNVLGDLY